MAIRYREKYKSWQVYWNNPVTGKRESRSFPDQKEAEKENSLILHRLRFEPETFAPPETEVGTDCESVPTFEQCYLDYLTEKQFSKQDLGRHRSCLLRALRLFGAKPVDQITTDDLETLKRELLSSSLRSGSVRDILATTRTVIKYIERKSKISIGFPQIPMPRYRQLVPPSPEEITRLYTAAAPHLKRVIILGAYCGVRVGPCEMFQLTWEDVDLQNRILRVHGSRKNKNVAYREVPIRESLVSYFEAWQAVDLLTGCQYLIAHGGRPIRQIFCAWQTAKRRAGITRELNPYSLRHAFATELIAAGVDVGTVAKLMGHSNPMMLLTHYQYVLDRQKRQAVEALPELHVDVPQPCAAATPASQTPHQ